MNDELKEQLSAFMDGELLAEEKEIVLQALKTEEPVRAQWAHYHLIHDSLQHQLPATFLHDVAGRVSQALENESPPPVERHPVTAAERWRYPWKYAAGLALAASLSAITVLGFQAFTSEPVMPEPRLASAPPSASEPRLASTPPSAFSHSNIVPVAKNADHRQTLLAPEVERRLSSYVVNHTEYIAMPRMIRYGRLVSYENPR